MCPFHSTKHGRLMEVFMTPFPLTPFHSLPQGAVLVDVPIIISLLIDTPLPCFSIPRSFTSSPLLGVGSFLKLKASEKVQELLDVRYHVAVLALEGLLSASVSFSLMRLIKQESIQRECPSLYLTSHPDLPRLGQMHPGCAPQTLPRGFELHRTW